MTDVLDIAKPAPCYSIERTLSRPEWWRGAANARAELYAAERLESDRAGIVRAQAISAAVAAGTPLADIPEYREWLGGR